MRIVYTLLFCVLYSFTDILIALVALIQTVIAVVTGSPNAALQEFGARLGVYLKQISEFISYATEEKPYPFADWPETDLKIETSASKKS